jgi:hypothetical protein
VDKDFVLSHLEMGFQYRVQGDCIYDPRPIVPNKNLTYTPTPVKDQIPTLTSGFEQPPRAVVQASATTAFNTWNEEKDSLGVYGNGSSLYIQGWF